MIVSSSFQKFYISTLTACICGLMSTSVALASTGEIDKPSFYKDWFSGRLCTFDRCVWRAATISPISPDDPWILTIDKESSGDISINMQSHLSIENVRSWGERDNDIVFLKVRVDHKKTREIKCVRTIDRNTLSLYWSIEVDDKANFISEIKNGNTLRIRVYKEEAKATIPFSLSGAHAAIDRALSENYSSSGRTDSNSGLNPSYDPYFDDSPSSRI